MNDWLYSPGTCHTPVDWYLHLYVYNTTPSPRTLGLTWPSLCPPWRDLPKSNPNLLLLAAGCCLNRNRYRGSGVDAARIYATPSSPPDRQHVQHAFIYSYATTWVIFFVSYWPIGCPKIIVQSSQLMDIIDFPYWVLGADGVWWESFLKYSIYFFDRMIL